MYASDAQSFLPIAHALADVARPIAKKYFRQPVTIETKGDASPVTIADREIEAAMVAYLKQHVPDHGIFGEEHGTHNEGAKWTWVLDPIDGTKSFIMGRPTFGTLIALAFEGKPVLGVIDQPILGERWVGCEGLPTTFNGEICRVRQCEKLSDAICATTTPAMFAGKEYVLDALMKNTKSVVFGGDCYAYAMLASGFVDLVVEADLKAYDFMALVPVVTGAGGFMTDWTGAPLNLEGDGEVLVSSTRSLYAECMYVLLKSS